ncbi:MAG: lactate utilization protein C [Alphaproteobacteria bacterium]|nr:lactate utilization protein C [Alphaproteobacteria bacterium]
MTRDAILVSIRDALGRGPLGAEARDLVSEHIRRHARNLVPDRGNVDADTKVALFSRQIQETHATLEYVATTDDVPGAITRYLSGKNLPAKVVLAPALAKLPWNEQPLLETKVGATRGEDAVAVTGAFAAIAETGTLLLTSGAESPQTLHLLPEHHVVVVRRDQVVGSMEDCWDRLRAQGPLPRTAMFVSGPSSTADIELTHYLGAHGPRRLHVIVVDR